MAREVIIRIKDDFDPDTLADKTVPFGYNGTNYEIDLTAANADQFDADMARYVKAARVVVPEKPKRAQKKYKDNRARHLRPEEVPVYEQRQRIRAWANLNGSVVAEKGMIANEIITAYAVTHPDDPILPGTRTKAHRKPTRKPRLETVAAQDGGEQSVSMIVAGGKPRSEVGLKAAATSRKRAYETGRFGLSEELRAKIRAWGASYGQAATGQLKTEVVEAYFSAHPDEKTA